MGGGGIRRGFVLDKTLCDFLLGSLSTVQAPGLIGETEANFQPGVNKQTKKKHEYLIFSKHSKNDRVAVITRRPPHPHHHLCISSSG